MPFMIRKMTASIVWWLIVISVILDLALSAPILPIESRENSLRGASLICPVCSHTLPIVLDELEENRYFDLVMRQQPNIG